LTLLWIISIRRSSGTTTRRRLALTFACALVMVGIAAGFAGCGGGSSTSGGGTTSHVDSITAVYSGDSTYVGSTSPAVAVTVNQ
jgi:hypothetical protein